MKQLSMKHANNTFTVTIVFIMVYAAPTVRVALS